MVTGASVAIAGGSIGGLTAGLLLRDLGCDVTIYERSPVSLESRGAGIGLLPDAARYLVERAGLPLADVTTSCSQIRYLRRDGSVAHTRDHEYRFSSWNTVFNRLRARFPDDRYHLGSEAVGVEQDDAAATLLLASGERISADLVVAADGISSCFRSIFLPDARRAYVGYVAWRGMVPESHLPDAVVDRLDGAITYYFYPNSQILVYLIPGPEGEVGRGHRLVNIVWYRNYAEGDDLTDLMTDTTGWLQETTVPPGLVREHHVRELRAHSRARLPGLIADVIDAIESPFIQAVYDLDVDRMAFGRVCLVGDAGTVMRPHAAAGTAKASANAWALAEAMAAHATVPEALAAWEPEQVRIGRELAERTQRLGTRSQVLSDIHEPEDDTIFRLREEGP